MNARKFLIEKGMAYNGMGYTAPINAKHYGVMTHQISNGTEILSFGAEGISLENKAEIRQAKRVLQKVEYILAIAEARVAR